MHRLAILPYIPKNPLSTEFLRSYYDRIPQELLQWSLRECLSWGSLLHGHPVEEVMRSTPQLSSKGTLQGKWTSKGGFKLCSHGIPQVVHSSWGGHEKKPPYNRNFRMSRGVIWKWKLLNRSNKKVDNFGWN